MSYFVNREEQQRHHGRARASLPSHQDRPQGKGRGGEVVLRGDVVATGGSDLSREARIEHELEVYNRHATAGGFLNRFGPAREPDPLDLQRRHPQIVEAHKSHVFEGPKADPVPTLRVHKRTDEELRLVAPPPDDRRDTETARIASGPTMIDKIISCNYPQQRPVEKPVGKMQTTEFGAKINSGQMSLGAFVPEEVHTRPRGMRKAQSIDYAAYIPDKLAPKKYYVVDGRTVAAQQAGDVCKNFFSGEPLLCARAVGATEHNADQHSSSPWAQPSPPISARLPPEAGVAGSLHHAGPAALPPIPEPPHRKAPFEHGRRVVQ